MLFNSVHFFLFFPIVCITVFILPQRFRWIWLLIASYFYYLSWNPKFIILLLASTVITWGSGLLLSTCDRNSMIERKRLIRKKWIVGISFFLNLLILFVFKYFKFALYGFNQILKMFHLQILECPFDVLLPIGISFYILQALSYTMDVYRKKVLPERNFFRYALFVSFFPQILSGPIERASHFLPQLRKPILFDFDRVKHGLCLMIWGFFQKLVIADRAALFANTVFDNEYIFQNGGLINVLAVMFFSFQIYCDFAGYSNIAIGAAQVFGFEIIPNFKRPFFSKNASEFWTRWHISLSTWFINCLYIPMGGNRVNKIRYYINLMTIFLASGLWHGASMTYIIWGGLNGLFCVIEKLFSPLWARLIQLSRTNVRTFGFRCIQAIYTFILFSISVTFFRSESISHAVAFFRGMRYINFDVILSSKVFDYGLDPVNFCLLCLSLLILFLVSWNQRSGSLRLKIDRQPLPVRWGLVIGCILFIFFFGVYGPIFDASRFFYVQF